MRRHPGIQKNVLVSPFNVTVFSRNVKAKTTEDFTFSMPNDIKQKLQDLFRKSCSSTNNEQEREMREDTVSQSAKDNLTK